MKLLSIICAVAAFTSLTTAASPPKRQAKRKSLARRDPHRMLKKRVASYAAASGPGQGRIEFASLQNAIVAGSLANKDKARRSLQKKQDSRKVRSRQATIFEKRDDGDDNNNNQAGPAAATSDADDSTSSDTDAAPAVAANNAISLATTNTQASSDDGDDQDCEDEDDGDDSTSASQQVAAPVRVANVAKPAPAANASPAPAPSNNNGQQNNNGGSSNNGQQQNSSNNSGSNNNGGNSGSNNNNGSSNNNSGSSSSSSSGSSGGSSGSASQGTGQVHSGGQATWFTQNGNAGACGTVHSDSDFVVALPPAAYAGGANCGKTIVLTDASSGATQNAIVADLCPSCGNPGDVDCSVGLFTKFASQDAGVFSVSWQFAG